MKNINITIFVVLGIALVLFLIFARPMRWNMPWLWQDQMPHDEYMNDNHHMYDDFVESYEIYPGKVAQKIEKGEDIILLDVRTPEEYEEIHLEGALLLPVEELSQQTLNTIGLGQDKKDEEIIIYCRSGSRSKIAYDVMKSLGYTNITSVSGGMIHWQEDNYPFIETGPHQGPSWSDDTQTTQIETVGGPKITIENQLHDFGVVPQYGGVVTKDFTVENTGSVMLEIGSLTTSCSCTSAEVSRSSIPAGESAVLTVTFDPDFHEEPGGVFKRTVFIPTNDPNTPEAEIVIQVDVAEGQ